MDSGCSPVSGAAVKNHGLWDLLHLNWSKTSNVIRGEAEAMFTRARDTGALLTMTSRKRRKIPEQQEGKRRVSGAGSKLSGKACGEPHGDLDECSSLSICPSPSLSYLANSCSSLMSGMYTYRHNAICFSDIKIGNFPPHCHSINGE